jgi:hypothetical protein
MELQTNRVARAMLEARYQRVIDQARAAQRGGTAWSDLDGVRALPLDGALFLPDDEEQRNEGSGRLIGGLIAAFGTLFVLITLDGSQAEPWMRYAGPGLVAVGAYLWWVNREKPGAAQSAPKLTGAYLFDDGLLHVSTAGCRTFPRAHLRGFESRRHGDDGVDKRTYARLADGGEAYVCAYFGGAYARELNRWLASSIAVGGARATPGDGT